MLRRTSVGVAVLLGLAGCGGESHDKGKGDDLAGSSTADSGTSSSQTSDESADETPNTSKSDAEATPENDSADDQEEPSEHDQPSERDQPSEQNTPSNSPEAEPAHQDAPAATSPTKQGIAPPEGFKPDARNECDLHSGWAGDEYCILPPPPDKGFQLHIGPSNYENPEPTYVLQPGRENVHTYTAKSANDRDIYFYVRQYRMRPGAHHTIVRDTSTGRRLSGSNVNQDHPRGGITAPENAGIGIPLVAHAPISVDHHAINITDKPLLQEVWVNFWYVDPDKVTEATNLLYDPGSITDTVGPHQDAIVGPYACDITKPGRLISVFGHVHANNVRFSAWRTRNGARDLFYESYHWEEPLWLEYTSLAKNPLVDAANKVDGGWTGILDLQPGDALEWECHEVNQQDTTLRFVNETYKGQMCIIIGDLVGTKCQSRNPTAMFNPNLE